MKQLIDEQIQKRWNKLAGLNESVEQEYKEIIAGFGWATDEYIDNFINLSEQDKIKLMLKLAKNHLLFDEDKIKINTTGEKPKKGLMTIKDVMRKWERNYR